MKRMIIAILTVGFFVALTTLSAGCSDSGGRYFGATRQNKPHPFRNRIYNPADCRYVADASNE